MLGRVREEGIHLELEATLTPLVGHLGSASLPAANAAAAALWHLCVTVDAKATVVKAGDKVLLVDDLVATGGTLSSGIELVRKMGGTA